MQKSGSFKQPPRRNLEPTPLTRHIDEITSAVAVEEAERMKSLSERTARLREARLNKAREPSDT